MRNRLMECPFSVLCNSSIFDSFEVQGIDSFPPICVAHLNYLKGIMMLMGLWQHFNSLASTRSCFDQAVKAQVCV